MRFPDKYDWDTRDNANTLLRAEEIKKDPIKYKLAQECISDTLKSMKEVAKGSGKSNGTPSRHNNPATLKKL